MLILFVHHKHFNKFKYNRTYRKSDDPNRDNVVIPVHDPNLGLHADDSTLPTRDRSFIQQREYLRQLSAGVRGLFDFDGI